MPSAGQISFVHDQTRMRWMTSLTSGRFQPPLVLPEGDTIDFVFRWSNNGTLFTPAVTPVWIFGIKDATTPSGDFLIQVNTASANAGVYTFTVPISSAELQTWLATATSQSYVALQITDTANGIATTPLLCQITANQNDTGTTPTSANGTLNVAAGKTVTFPLSLTFPSAAGTNGYKLTTNGGSPETLTWTPDTGITTLTVGTTTVTSGTTTRVLYNNAGVVGEYAISGTGSVAMTTSPSFTTPSLGAATATSINGIAMESLVVGPASATADAIVVYDGTTGRLVKNSVVTVDSDGFITTTGNVIANFCYGTQGFELGGGSLGLHFLDANELNNIKISAPAGLFSSDKTQTLQNASGTIALTSDITGGTLAGSFTTLAASGVTSITNTTDASSTTTASLKTAGGLGVVKTAWLGADIRFATNGAGGAGNIFLGTTTSRAGNGATTTGAQNVCIGSYAGYILTSGQGNVILGDQAGSALTTGSYNMCIGYTALGSASIGADYNIAVGPASLLNVTSGDNNVGIGRNAGNTVTTGLNNTFIGYDSDGVAGLSNQTAIGTGATCTAANQVMLGTSSDAVVVPGTLAVTGGTIYGTYTVGTFPATTYLEAVVTDALAPTVGATVSAGGSAKCKVMYNGSAKIVTAVL